MTTASSTSAATPALSVRVEVHAQAISLQEDAERASFAAAERLRAMTLPGDLAKAAAELSAAIDGEIAADPTDTELGTVMQELVGVAGLAATEGWHNPDGAEVTVELWNNNRLIAAW